MPHVPEERTPVERTTVREQQSPAVAESGVAPLGIGSVLALQRSAGNRAVTDRMPDASGREAPPLAVARPTPGDASLQRAIADSAHERRAGGISVARLLRSGLRAGAARRLLRVATSGGDWSTDKYDLLRDTHPQTGPLPASAGLRGVDMVLRFKPGATVDAESIGLTQSVISFVNNAPNMTASQAAVAIPHADAKPAGTGPGETDETAAIDRAEGFNNPIYAVDNTASTSLSDQSTDPGWGELGYHYKDLTGAPKAHDAVLKDIPARGRAQKDSRHIFETTAVATKGAQAGTYYGSVRWGWRTDAAGAFTKIPFDKVSDGVPSSTFMKAAELWNPAKSSTGKDHVDLPLVDVKVTAGPVTLTLPGPFAAIALPVGTRLQIIRPLAVPMASGTVKVVDGPHTGKTGEVSVADWGQIRDERA